jgi:hypothetical protein
MEHMVAQVKKWEAVGATWGGLVVKMRPPGALLRYQATPACSLRKTDPFPPFFTPNPKLTHNGTFNRKVKTISWGGGG